MAIAPNSGSSSAPAGLRVGPADVACWALVGELGSLDSRTIHARCYGDLLLRGCQRRLRLAVENKFLVRAQLQVAANWGLGEAGGSLPAVYGITDLAADWVERETGVRPPRVLRSEPAAATLLHRMDVVRHRLAFDDGAAAAGLAAPAWIMEQDVWAEAPAGAPPNQRRLLYHQFGGKRGVTCQPDGACWVEVVSRQTGKTTDVLCLWETDRSTEGQKQIARKLPGYAAYVREKAWKRYDAGRESPVVRILWVCPSGERRDQLLATIRESEVATICRLAVSAELTAESAFFEPIWLDAEGSLRPFLNR